MSQDRKNESENESLAALELIRRERDKWRREALKEAKRCIELDNQLKLFGQMSKIQLRVPRWSKPNKSRKKRATACLVLSDLHLDEVVNPNEIFGVNYYNRTIAEMRLERTFRKTIQIFRDYINGFNYDGCVVFLGGDLISGFLHDLPQSNEDTNNGTVVYWAPRICAGLELLADFFGKVHVASVVGNHGRNTLKPRTKFRARDNHDWLLSNMVRWYFDIKKDKRFTWQIPESADVIVDIYDHHLMLTHGDQFTGGNGMAGIFSPLLRGEAKKSKRQVSIDQPFDYLICGHFHQWTPTPKFLINGSLKGYDELAYQSNYTFEPPTQAAFVTTPEHGPTLHVPIFCCDREAEGW